MGDGGVFLGASNPQDPSQFDTITPRNYGLETALVYDIDVSLTNPNLIIAGLQDNGTTRYLGDVGENHLVWQEIRDGDGLYSLISPSNNDIMYSQCQLLHDTRQSHDGGTTWDDYSNDDITGLIETGGAGDPNSKFITVDPANPDHILAQGPVLQESWDGGRNWAEQSGFRLLEPGVIKGSLERMIFEPEGGSFFAATSDGQIWQSPKHSIYVPPPTLVDYMPGLGHPRLALSHGDSRFLYVLSNGSPKIRRIWYAGSSGWQVESIVGDLPQKYLPSNTSIIFYSIAVDPQDENVVYLGTDKGVYRGQATVAEGWKWTPYNMDLPYVKVSDLISIPATKELRAATYGRGVWTVKVDEPPIAKITTPQDGAVFYSDQQISFRGYGYDPEETIPPEALLWKSDISGPLGTGTDIFVKLPPGNHKITLTAKDSFGLVGSDTISVTVKAGPSGMPTARILVPADGASFAPGTLITFKGSGTDPEDGELTGDGLTWFSDKDGLLGHGNVIETTLSIGQNSEQREHIITLQAKDSDGNVAEDKITVHIFSPR